MRAKRVTFEVTYIDLRNKPEWFLRISPHGKVPVLLVDDQPLFESNAIAEFLDEQVDPHLHPDDAIKRARNRAWTDFVATFAAGLNGVTYCKADEDLAAKLAGARKVLDRLEEAIAVERTDTGPYFNGRELSLVDAAYAPFLQRFTIAEAVLDTGLLNDYPLVGAWSETLCADDRVTGAVADNFSAEFAKSLERRGTRAWQLMAAA